MGKAPANSSELKQQLQADIEQQAITLGEATRRMRKITGMTQTEYAQKIVGISPRILMDVEKGYGNPTLETLNKIGKPFGLTVAFARKKHQGKTR